MTRTGRLILGIAFIAAAAGPWWLGDGPMRFLSELFLMLAMAQMWNLLAGYAGLVSMGQQVFVGLGAYCLFVTSIALNLAPFWVLLAAPVFCAAVAAVVALFLFRLREGVSDASRRQRRPSGRRPATLRPCESISW